jgi:hypothetical protein
VEVRLLSAASPSTRRGSREALGPPLESPLLAAIV